MKKAGQVLVLTIDGAMAIILWTGIVSYVADGVKGFFKKHRAKAKKQLGARATG